MLDKFRIVLFISVVTNLMACGVVSSEDLSAAEKKSPRDNVNQTNNSVSIKKYKFIPPTLTIKQGESVTWINNEKRQYHSVWFEQSGDKESDYLFPDDQYTKTFSSKGTFTYKCGPHPEMTGIIIVE